MKRSAGLFLYRKSTDGGYQVLLVHPGGPFWASKDTHAWSAPKGEYSDSDDPLTVAYREFTEELGSNPPAGTAVELGELRQPGGKLVRLWALQGDFDPSKVHSNTFQMEWPPRSGQQQEFPEVDKADWFSLEEARVKLHKGQVQFVDLFKETLAK